MSTSVMGTHHGYTGDIYDAHTHLWGVQETIALPTQAGDLKVAIRPISIVQNYDLYMFYVGANGESGHRGLGVRGFVNLALSNLGGLGDPTSTYEHGGVTATMSYRRAEADGDFATDNLSAFSGNILAPAALYTQLASYEADRDAYHSFAFAGPDWADIREGILDGSIQSMEDLKARLRAQLEQMRDIGFVGLKLVSEWFSERNGKWGCARHLVGVESISSEADPWSPGGEMFNGPGGVFATAAELGTPVTIHTYDGVREQTEAFWAEGGIFDQVLGAHPGLKLNVAHGFVLANTHPAMEHNEHDHPEVAQHCDRVVSWVMALLERYDGREGRSKLTIDMVGSQINWWVEHNEAFREGRATTHDYRDLLISHSEHFMLGIDPVNLSAVSYQTDGCGGDGLNRLERGYLLNRINLEGPYQEENPNVRFLDLVSEGDTLQRIYRDNLFEWVSAQPSQSGPAGLDARGVRRIDCELAEAYVVSVQESVRSDDRGTVHAEDPLVVGLQEILDQIDLLCVPQ